MTRPRLLLISQPTPELLQLMLAAAQLHGLPGRLGAAMFAAGNWHQSWSGRYPDTPGMRACLRRAGARIGLSAAAFTLPFNRIGGQGHWELRARGIPAGFTDLLTAVRAALLEEGLDGPGHSPHMTISYRPREALPMLPIPPIEWPIHEIRLVVGDGEGDDYRYETLESWELLTAPVEPQLCLF